jgi:hypothetical protein
MMKMISLFSLVLSVCLLAGCGASLSTGSYGTTSSGGVQMRYSPDHTFAPSAPMMGPAVAPAMMRGYMPPQNVGSVTTDINCPAVLAFDVVNHTSNNTGDPRTGEYIALMLDGQPVTLVGYGVLPMLPSGETVSLCLNRPGTHVVAGTAFALRGGVPVKVGQFSIRASFTRKTGNRFYIEDSDIR